MSELDGQVVAGLFDRGGRGEGLEEPVDVRSVDFLGDPAPSELGQQGVHAAHEPGPVVTDVGVALGQQAQYFAVADRPPTRAGCADLLASRGHGGRVLERAFCAGI